MPRRPPVCEPSREESSETTSSERLDTLLALESGRLLLERVRPFDSGEGELLGGGVRFAEPAAERRAAAAKPGNEPARAVAPLEPLAWRFKLGLRLG